MNDHDHDRPKDSPVIRTFTGAYVDVLNITPDDIFYEDIIVPLTRICRYGGHIATHYSVAEHSIYVSNMLLRLHGDKDVALAGLLHDAAEAYIGDIPRPLKETPAFHYYADTEKRINSCIEQKYHLQVGLDDPQVKEIDREIVGWEMAMFRDNPMRRAPDPDELAVVFHQQWYTLCGDGPV